MVEHLLAKEGVASSNLVFRSIETKLLYYSVEELFVVARAVSSCQRMDFMICYYEQFYKFNS